MKKQRFFRLLGDLDDQILEQYRQMDVELSHKALRRKRALRALIIAACLVLLIGACVPVGMMLAGQSVPGPGGQSESETEQEPGKELPEVWISVGGIDEIAVMREMSVCEDEQQLTQYLESLDGNGIQSRQDLIDFLELVDHTPYPNLIEGEIVSVYYECSTSHSPACLRVEKAADSGERVYYTHLVSVEDAAAYIAQIEQELAQENLLSAPLSVSDGRLILYTERRLHVSPDHVIEWWGLLDGAAVQIQYAASDISGMDTAALLDLLEVADSIILPKPQFAWTDTEFGAFVDSPKRYIYSFVDSPDSEFATGNVLDIYADWYKDPSAPETITVVYRGQEYSLSYSHSKTMAWKSMQACHEYTCKDVKGLMVSIDQVTGEIVLFDFFTPPEADAKELPMEQLEEIAYAFLAEKVSDPKAYRLETPKQDGEEVSYTFVRYLGELPTSDRVELLLTTRGDVIAYGLGYLGAMRNAPPIPDSLIQIVHNELGRYVSRDGECGIERVILTPTGQLALDCYIDNGNDGAYMLFYITEPIE